MEKGTGLFGELIGVFQCCSTNIGGNTDPRKADQHTQDDEHRQSGSSRQWERIDRGGPERYAGKVERANLARRFPEKLAELRSRYQAWEAEMPPIPEVRTVSSKDTPLSNVR